MRFDRGWRGRTGTGRTRGLCVGGGGGVACVSCDEQREGEEERA